GVEDDVRREGLEPRDEPRRRACHVHTLDAVASLFERLGDRVNRLGRVELGLFFGIGEPQVVREGDAHGVLRPLAGLALGLYGYSASPEAASSSKLLSTRAPPCEPRSCAPRLGMACAMRARFVSR